MVIEKADAKMQKSFEKIEGGKVHMELAELTEGIPMCIKITEDLSQNTAPLWEKLIRSYENGFMLGAGTPEHPQGDAYTNQNGIVQGHAYAILKVQEFQGNKLIQLRNPQGDVGSEWNGDWSDDAPEWTPAACKALGPENVQDGSLWMNVEGLACQYNYVYICRKFGKNWARFECQDECNGKTNIKDGVDTFQQYIIKIHQPTTLFVKMSQFEKVNSFLGEKCLFLVISDNKGKKTPFCKTDHTLVTSLPTSPYVSVTTEVFIDASYMLPISLTLVAGAVDKKLMGSPCKFALRVFSTDKKMQVTKIQLVHA
eukprot:TRINITY_DN19986_c0_g1_i1.p1 TRINITY_DN19986_c0_g1~~TRINITY_DN19986_c0_g1_i1.p1  ORF type:complete len:312 (+),score=45.61 TRINITY_DN19986_c0_g1_i1:2-937(+)